MEPRKKPGEKIISPHPSLIPPKARLYQLDIPIIGLTGGIATGKSTVSHYIGQKNHAVICADELVKNIYARSQEIHHFLKTHTPDLPNVIDEKNTINFKKLREVFFSNSQDTTLKNNLEQLIYKNLPDAFWQKLQEFKNCSNIPFIIYDVPLLFEKKMEASFDLVVLVYAPYKIQLKRLMKRDGIDERLAHLMLKGQMDIEEKKQKTQIIFYNDKDLKFLHAQVDNFLNHLLF